jgi:predicted nucleic-acid-binding protein
MITIDTNILVRIFLNDDPQDQVKAARALLAQKKQKVFVSVFTLLECAWVLKNKGFSPLEIAGSFERLIDANHVEVSMREVVVQGIKNFKESSNKVGFGDCLVLADSQQSRSEKLYTFDEAFLKFSDHYHRPKTVK